MQDQKEGLKNSRRMRVTLAVCLCSVQPQSGKLTGECEAIADRTGRRTLFPFPKTVKVREVVENEGGKGFLPVNSCPITATLMGNEKEISGQMPL